MRFDFSGIGDSTIVNGDMLETERVIKDTHDAMSYMAESYNLSDFVLCGNCTGADIAHRVAVNDSRVSGSVFLDGYRYRTWKYYYRWYIPVMAKPLRMFKKIFRSPVKILSSEDEFLSLLMMRTTLSKITNPDVHSRAFSEHRHVLFATISYLSPHSEK